MEYLDTIINAIKTTTEYPPFQVFMLVIVVTQFVKQYLTEKHKSFYDSTIRLVAIVVGIFGGVMLIEQNFNGVLYGVIISLFSTAMYKLLVIFLNREAAKDWQKKFGNWLSSKK